MQEVKEEKEKLKAKMLMLINNFEEKTGVCIDEINLQKDLYQTMLNGNAKTEDIEIKIEI